MTYLVEVSDAAYREAEDIYRWLAERTPQHSITWFNGLADAIDSLAAFPNRHPIAPESAACVEAIRHLIYGKSPHGYRILFLIRKKYCACATYSARCPASNDA